MEWNSELMVAALDQSVSDTFEQMAFMEVCPVSGDARADGISKNIDIDTVPDESNNVSEQSIRWARISVANPLDIEFWIGCPAELLAEISETVFSGMEFPPEMDVQGDTLAELANMIAGSFLAHLYPDDSTLMLGLPDVAFKNIPVPESAHSDSKSLKHNVYRRCYALDDERCIKVQIHST